MKTCTWGFMIGTDEPCGEVCEGRTEYCATHNRQLRKEETENQKSLSKRAAQLQRQKEKNKLPRKRVNPVSEKRKYLNETYTQMRTDFLRMTKECEAKVNEYCTNKPETIHHKRGRGKYFLAPETWLPCCMLCHVYIEQHPKEAKERGWSESRLATIKPTI